MTCAPVRTWKDLLLIDQDTSVIYPRVIEGQGASKTSSFSLPAWNPERLPSAAHLFQDFPSRMREHLVTILDQHYPTEAAGTTFTFSFDHTITADFVLGDLGCRCIGWTFNLSHEGSTRSVAGALIHQVIVIYGALTGNYLDVRDQDRTSDGSVITDHGFRFELDGGIKILWEDKSSRDFDRLIGELMGQMRDRSTVRLCMEPVPTPYRGYEAILGKLGYHAGDFQSRVRWAIIFSGLRYMIIYIPRTPGRPQMYCSPVMQFSLPPDEKHEPAIQPPIWSVIVYMLLVETLDIDDDDLRQRLGLVVPMGDPDLGSKVDGRGRGRTMEVDETSSHLVKCAVSITVQCLDAYPIELLRVNASDSHRAKEQDQPFIHFDRHLSACWSSVFASSKSHVVVKFAAVPKKDKASLVDQLNNEKAAYKKLNRVAGWIIPHLYGEYQWYGGRALILSDEGQSLSHLEDFKSLPLVERLILFVEMYCMHYLGVKHVDFEPQNVVRKRCYSLKIIDFGFSDVDHTCSGWRECDELEEAWDKLQLFRFGLDRRFFLLSMIVFPLLAFVITSGIPANWRLWPRIH